MIKLLRNIIGIMICFVIGILVYYLFKYKNNKFSNIVTVGIPCIPKHIQHLNELIININNQELLPKEIIISLSESNDEDGKALEKELNDISISPIRVIASVDKKYAGENRNICGRHCNTEVISFIDSDDLMCSSRIRVLDELYSLLNYDVLFHNHTNIQSKCSNNYGNINNKEITKKQYLANNTTDETKSVNIESVAHGHLTIKKDILNKYPIDINGYGEDTRYLHKLFKNNLDVISLPDYYGTVYRQQYSSWK